MAVDLEANSALLTDVLEEAISCTPQTWDRGMLTLDCDGSYIQYKLKNEASPDKAAISERLRHLCEQFYVSMAEQGSPWLSAFLQFWKENEQWKFKVDFKYAETEAAGAPPDVSMPPRRPWWKLWH